MTNEIIERAARAICAAGGQDPDARVNIVGAPDRALWEAYIPEARAAVAAMREPTEAMLNAAFKAEADAGGNSDKAGE
jgi:hypothetical protein